MITATQLFKHYKTSKTWSTVTFTETNIWTFVCNLEAESG